MPCWEVRGADRGPGGRREGCWGVRLRAASPLQGPSPSGRGWLTAFRTSAAPADWSLKSGTGSIQTWEETLRTLEAAEGKSGC